MRVHIRQSLLFMMYAPMADQVPVDVLAMSSPGVIGSVDDGAMGWLLVCLSVCCCCFGSDCAGMVAGSFVRWLRSTAFRSTLPS